MTDLHPLAARLYLLRVPDLPESEPSTFTHTGDGGVRMVDVGGKAHTQRSATVEATVVVGPALARAIAANQVKKGDVLGTAQLAGIAAAKRTADLIPLCHPLPIDGVRVSLTLDEGAGEVRVQARVSTVWKTGVEMEAFVCATAAALTVIDMGKAIERDCRIREVRLLEKTGGSKGAFRADAPAASSSLAQAEESADRGSKRPKNATVRGARPWRVGVLTISDRVAAGAQEDAGGPAVSSAIGALLGEGAVVLRRKVADGEPEVVNALRELLGEGLDLILTTGGTGLAARDLTPEATAKVIERGAPGLMELARARCAKQLPLAALSRGIAGTVGETLVLNLPGSPRGAVETLDALADVLPHALATLGSSAPADADPRHGRV